MSGRAAEARSRASWAACESLNDPTWITQLPIDGPAGRGGCRAGRNGRAGDALIGRRRLGEGLRRGRRDRQRGRGHGQSRRRLRDDQARIEIGRGVAGRRRLADRGPGREPHRLGRGEAVVHQLGHHAVALAGAVAAHHHADQAAIVAHRRHHEIEAGSVGIAGLEAVGAVVGQQHAIVVLENAAAIGIALHREDRIVVREIAHQREGEPGQVARRRDLVAVGQARGIAKHRRRHAELAGLVRHELREAQLRRRPAPRRARSRHRWPSGSPAPSWHRAR